MGIPPGDLAHVFERFYRVEKARSREAGGTGLGLSIVKHIIGLHGGEVRAESAFGKGTAIVIQLPMRGLWRRGRRRRRGEGDGSPGPPTSRLAPQFMSPPATFIQCQSGDWRSRDSPASPPCPLLRLSATSIFPVQSAIPPIPCTVY